MDSLVLDFDQDGSRLALSGDIDTLLRNRRVSIFLRDYLGGTREHGGLLSMPIGQEQLGPLVKRIEDALGRHGLQCNRSSRLSNSIGAFLQAEQAFAEFSKRAYEIWNNEIPPPEFSTFVEVLCESLPGRTLYPLQLLAAYHLAFAQNAANFSVPGAGKTSVVYGAFAFLRSLQAASEKRVNKLLVVGPLSSFGPWESEFAECFGSPPRSRRLFGGVPKEERKRILYSELPSYKELELVLTSYQSVPGDLEYLQHFLTRPGNRVMMVLDEAHKIKNTAGGIWAEAVLELAPLAAARVVLTGTPAPNGYEDLYNLFRFIWPNQDIIRFHLHHLREMSQNPFDSRVEKLIDNISPFFIRIRKSDLGLPPPIERQPIVISMGDRQERIYRFIEEKYISYFESKDRSSWVRDTLTRARLIRLMQASTNPGLLRSPLDLDESGEAVDAAIFVDDAEILREVFEYERNEVPAKFREAINLTTEILDQNATNKVVLWCVFVQNLFALQELLAKRGIDSRVLYGGTPTETDADAGQMETRESIVNEFNRVDSDLRVVIANPFAVGESISLHKACRHAIYVERNFNGGAFLQSKDRIHRYGLPATAQVNYYYLTTFNSVDETIHNRLLEKEASMLRILESKTIPLIDMNVATEEADSADDISAIIRDYASRRANSR